jgi:anti-anti-sigma regulatory factor
MQALPVAVLDTLPMAVMACEVLSRTSLRVVFMNRKAAGSAERQASLVGLLLAETLPPAALAKMLAHCQVCLDSEAPLEVEDSYETGLGLMWARTSYLPMRIDEGGPISHIVTMWEDITARKQRELEEHAQQEAIIEHQAAALKELSTPLLAINDQTMVLPLIGAIDSRRAQVLLSTLLDGVAARQAQLVILDITGVPLVDTQVAQVFAQAALALSLVGARLVITGIRPEVAQAMVGLGIGLQQVVTRTTLQEGIAYALKRV